MTNLSKSGSASLNAKYLLAIRKFIHDSTELAQLIADSDPAISCAADVYTLIAHTILPGTEEIFKSAIHEILEELDRHRQLPSSLYLIDQHSGKAVIPISERDIYQPPDYIGEDGKLQKSKPIVHPKITSSLALAQAEQYNRQKIQKLAEHPVHGLSYRHLTEPDQISELIRSKLEHIGFQFIPQSESNVVEMEFGREIIEADMQSHNHRFNRIQSYAAIVATKIVRLNENKHPMWMGPISLRKNSKMRWFVISFQFGSQTIPALQDTN
jgi:hypothetical protein